MSTLVSDLQDISRIEAGQLRLQPGEVSLAEVVEEVSHTLSKQIEEKGQTLEVALPGDLPAAWGDQTRMVQVLTNLISNAHKYTPDGRRILVWAERADNQWDREGSIQVIHTVVEDTGIGIIPEDQRKIFHQFFRSEDPRAREVTGTGLGLNIAKHLVELQGGCIWFESVWNQGTRIHFTIPVADGQSPPAPPGMKSVKVMSTSSVKTIKPLSEIVVEAGKIGKDKLEKVLSAPFTGSEGLGQRLVNLGLISETVLLETLGEYLDIPFISLKELPQQAVMLDSISEKFMRQYKFVPVALDNTVLTIAVSDPYDIYTCDAVRMVTNCEVKVNLAREEDILDAVGRLFNTDTTSMGRIIEDIGKDTDELSIDDEGDVDHLKDLASEAPVIRLVNLLITRAIELRASDIHWEPFEGDFKVRYRIDGVLHDVEAPPKRLQAAVISRIKIMAKLNIAERRLPQDGRIKLRVLGKEIDLQDDQAAGIHE